jgi:hypothetical protein
MLSFESRRLKRLRGQIGQMFCLGLNYGGKLLSDLIQAVDFKQS